MKFLLSILFIIFITFSISYSQSVEVFGGIALPQGDFGDDSGEGAGLAETGFGAGLQFNSDLNTPGLSWITSASLLINSTDESPAKNALKGEYGYDADIDVSIDSWMNIPLLTGLKYISQNPGTMNFYFIGQIGINIVVPPDQNISLSVYDSYYGFMDMNIDQSNDSANSFAFLVGGGLLISENINVGIRYFGLGEPEIKSKIRGTSTSGSQTATLTAEGEFKQNISVLLINIGISL